MQLGAREHYAVPRALQAVNKLQALITDTWLSPESIVSFGSFATRLKGRYHAELSRAAVTSGGLSWIASEALLRSKNALWGRSSWNLIVERNELFDRMACRKVRNLLKCGGPLPIVFAYSYAASATLQAAADKGCITVLGQIDGGPVEEEIVLREIERYPELGESYRPAPEGYWKDWRRQCAAASWVIVNSQWARSCMLKAGVEEKKLLTVPLFYSGVPTPAQPRTALPSHFTAERPLRVLFLGQVNVRKGIARLFEAIRLLRAKPIEFWLVGPATVSIPPDLHAFGNLRVFGAVDRSSALAFYSQADVFILPTLSDGFAITQIEAQSYGLPLVVSRYCGNVVSDGVNGILLEEISGASIAEALSTLLSAPDRIAQMSRRAMKTFSDVSAYGRVLTAAVGPS